MSKGTGTIRSETVASVYTNVTKDVAGDTVQERMTDALDSLSQDLYDDTIPYEAGESVIFEIGGVKRNYLCLAGTTPAESPSTTPAKWESITLGVVQVAKAEILYTNTSQTIIITLPTDAVINEIGLEVRILFDDSGTNLLDVGITGTGNRYINVKSIASTYFDNSGREITISFQNVPDRMVSSTNITFQYTGQNSDATQGQAFIYIYYIIF